MTISYRARIGSHLSTGRPSSHGLGAMVFPSGAKLGPARSWEKRLASNSCQHGRCHTANHGQVRWPASRLPGSRPAQCSCRRYQRMAATRRAQDSLCEIFAHSSEGPMTRPLPATIERNPFTSELDAAGQRPQRAAVRGSPSRDVRGLRGESRLAGPGRIGPDVPVVLQALFQTRSTWTRMVGNHGP